MTPAANPENDHSGESGAGNRQSAIDVPAAAGRLPSPDCQFRTAANSDRESQANVADALDLRGIHFTYSAQRRQPERQALRGVDLLVRSGESVALLGPNGSGKSTLMKIICGLLPPRDGSVRIFDRRPGDARPMLGVVFQSPALDPHMTVDENLRDQMMLFGFDRREVDAQIRAELDALEMTAHRRSLVKTLSGGMKRRVDLARALLHRPRLLLLDEPTAGLDPAARESFLTDLERRRSETGLTMLMSTHLTDEADRLDRVILMHEGVIVADDAPAALRGALGARMVTIPDKSWHPPETQKNAWSSASSGWTRALPDNDEEAAHLAASLTRSGVSFVVAPPSLADVFEHHTGSVLADAHAQLSQPPSRRRHR